METAVAPALVSAVPAPRERRTSRWLPSFADLLFMAMVYWLFLSSKDGFHALLLDADAGWHIRTGQWILAHGQVPHQDLYSFSKPGQPWFAWEWLSDVVLGSLHGAFGMKGVTLLAGFVIALTGWLMFRQAIARGANGLVALGVTLLGFSAASVHFHARPHIFTLVLFALSVALIGADRKRSARWFWLLVPVQILWTNLHGAFVLLPLLLGTSTVAALAETMLGWRTRGEGLALARRHGTALFACLLATVVNPYGIGLHQHIGGYLNSGWIHEVVAEFQAPTFRTESLKHYEALLLAGVALVVPLLRRRNLYEPLLLLGFAHMSLTSARHIPLYVLLAAPILAGELSAWWRRAVFQMPKASLPAILHSMGEDMRANCGYTSVWPFACAALVCFLPSSVVHWPIDFPSEIFPTKLVQQWRPLLVAHRTFTTDQWGDYLIYAHYPQQRVFFDGRSDFYGEALGREYLELMNGGHRWRELLHKHRIETVLCPPSWPLASLLKGSRDWRIVADSGKAVLFAQNGIPLAPPSRNPNAR